MGMKEKLIANAIAKTNIGKAFKSDPKGTFFMVVGNLITGIKDKGFGEDFKKYLKEKHGWIFE